PKSSGMKNVSQSFSFANCNSAPSCSFVVTNNLFLAASSPYLSINIALKMRSAIAGSVVAPDFEITLMEKSLFRSEEHTSELQSRFDLVCRLLLEKKKID